MANVLYNTKGRPLKIALIGGARTGKDTIAKYLSEKYNFKRLAFGDALKDYLFQVFPDLPTEPKPRAEMIAFGQLCREIDPNVWVKQLDLHSILCKSVGMKNLVITDVRQQNEIDYCKEEGYLLVKVVASPDKQRERALAGGEVLDVGNDLDKVALNFEDYDYKMENDGDLSSLFAQIETMLKAEK